MNEKGEKRWSEWGEDGGDKGGRKINGKEQKVRLGENVEKGSERQRGECR